MNISEKVIDIIKGMDGIGGIPTDEEFMNELDSRLDHLRVKSNSVLGDVVWQGEPCGLLHSTDWNGKCFKCGEQVFLREPK